MTATNIEEKKVPYTIQQLIQSDTYKKQFKNALPKYITADRFVRVALTILTRTPKLQKCSVSSLMACFLDCAQLGLEPNGREAHLIPYGEECKLIPDYKGLVKLARNSGEVRNIHADVVCEHDEFSYSFGTDAHLRHTHAVSGDRGKIIKVYSFVSLKDGSESFEVMNLDEIYATRDRSEGWKAFKAKKVSSSPWDPGKPDEKEMMKKTAFRRHSKWLPISYERFHLALEKDTFDAPEDIIDQPTVQPEIRMPHPKEEPVKAITEEDTLIGEPQQKMLIELAYKRGISDADWTEYLKKNFKIDHVKFVKKEWVADIAEWVGQQSSK